MHWSDKVFLITGGTGSFGQKFTEVILRQHRPKTIRIFSRGELKQWEMEKKFGDDPRLRFFIGDVRDRERLERAMDGANIVVHAAALKQVPLCEYNPFEAVMTNVIGAQNVINAAIDHNLEKVIGLSTDKAVNPVNLYGATKMCMEKLFVAANAYVGEKRQTRMSCVRYGNVIGSRGSVVPLFKQQRASGTVTITDKRMTRFWITLEQGVEFVIQCLELMQGGEIFVPQLPSMKVIELAETIASGCHITYSGIRPGEKINECLITEDEARHTQRFDEFFVITPEHPWWYQGNWKEGGALPEGFRYTSDNNDRWLTRDEFKGMIEDLET